MPDVARLISDIVASALWAIIGVFLLILSYKIFDRFDPVPYHEEIRKGNVAAGVVMGAVMIGMAIIIFAAIR